MRVIDGEELVETFNKFAGKSPYMATDLVRNLIKSASTIPMDKLKRFVNSRAEENNKKAVLESEADDNGDI